MIDPHRRQASSVTTMSSPRSVGDSSPELTPFKSKETEINEAPPNANFNTEVMIAEPTLVDSVCWISKFPKQEYLIDWDENSSLSLKVTRQEIEKYCKDASNFTSVAISNV